MFRKYSYYKHMNGRDAVMEVLDVEMTEDGYQLKAMWHILAHDGTPHPAPGGIREELISDGESEFWSLYEPPMKEQG